MSTSQRSLKAASSTKLTFMGRLLGRHSIRRSHIVISIFLHLVLFLLGILVLIPFLWMLSASLKPQAEIFTFPPTFIPSEFRWDNYGTGWSTLPFTQWLYNTVYVTGFTIAGQVLSAALVAFGFARLEFWGRDALFIVVLTSLMIPFHVTMIPIFILFRELGWIDTFLPLIVPPFFGGATIGGAFFIFLLRQFFLTIPLEMDDAARIDGCSTFGIFFHLIAPLSKPALGIVAVLTFMNAWNEFLQPLLFLQSLDMYTLSVGLRFFEGQSQILWGQMMAVSMLVLLPCIIVFFFAQRYFIQGIVVSGLKE